MKKFVTSLLLVITLASVSSTASTTLVSEVTKRIPIDLSELKLKWSNLGYGNTYFVKIIIPELAGVTILNHRNEGEDGPCLFTTDTNRIEDVLQGKPEYTEAQVKITLTKVSAIVGGTCQSSLMEDIETDIRGFKFQHSRRMALPLRDTADCH